MNRLPSNMTNIELARHQERGGAVAPYQPPHPQPTPPAAETEPDGPFQLMWRRRWIVAIMLLLCVAGGVAYMRVATPMYQGQARLMVTGDSPAIFGGGGGGGGKTLAVNVIAREQAMLSSGPVVERALAKFKPKEMKSFIGVRDPVSYVRKEMLVEPGRGDGTFTLTLLLADPKEAANVVNSVVEAYLEDRQQTNNIKKAIELLEREDARLAAEMRTSEDRLNEFQVKHGQISFGVEEKGNIEVVKLARLSDELTQLQILEMYARAELASAQNRLIAFNKWKQADLKLKNLQAAFDAQQKKALALNEKAAQFNRLQSDALRTKTLYEKVHEKLTNEKLNINTVGWDVRPLEQAEPARKPAEPSAVKVFALAVVAGLMLGFCGAWVREKTDHRLSSADEISQILGLPVLSIIPSMPGRSGAIARGQKVHLESMSDVAEAFRTLRTVVYFSVPENKGKTILMTSPFQGEGKSTTASGLAIAMAKAGRRTLMIDADLRKPTLHRIFELGDQVGVSSVMAGKATLEQAIQQTAVEGLDVLPCGPIPANPSEILNSKAFGEMLTKLAAKYDHIVLDSPPVLPVTDARILGATCDVTLLVLRANRSTRRMSEYAADAMLGVGARVLGVVVNDVPRNKRNGYYGGYGYGNYGYGRRGYEVAQLPPSGAATADGNGKGPKRLPKPAETSAA